MSKRTGKTVSLQELIDLVGVNAARYFFISRSLDTQMDFDLDLAKKNSSENPVYYVCYAYARICNCLKTVNNITEVKNYNAINSEEAYNVLEAVYQFSDVVKQAAQKRLPHLITNYVYNLAEKFHVYYSKNRIITEDKNLTMENLNMIMAVKITIKNALDLIGVIPPEKM
jgi:arginyl-tRNA synthetase